MKKTKSWVVLHVGWRFSRMGRLIRNLETGNLKRVLKIEDLKRWWDYAHRRALSGEQDVLLGLIVHSNEGPWMVWAVYDSFAESGFHSSYQLREMWVPKETSNDFCEKPEELRDREHFEAPFAY